MAYIEDFAARINASTDTEDFVNIYTKDGRCCTVSPKNEDFNHIEIVDEMIHLTGHSLTPWGAGTTSISYDHEAWIPIREISHITRKTKVKE